MSLGVLNNINAIYAANNLNNTSNSLSTVLQQLSSGSKINSGADDAAGLSLVNGLQANSQALSQSTTNATEGVGLLKVADGALSQVTNLLNRAVSLATEVSNGTLTSSQQTAANQEYQSILSEVSNIGSTTTFNQQQVFGSTFNIYTGDSTSAGSSVNSLNIRSLSSSNLGDTAGNMSYNNGQNNTFVNLSKSSTENASVSDSLSAATSSIAVNYLTKGSNGAYQQATATISAGTGTNYADTAQGLINAINGSGLGLTASFGTALQAGSAAVTAAGGAADQNETGIIISGSGVSTGAAPGVVDTMVVTNQTSGTADVLSGTVSLVGADGKTHSLTIGASDNTAATLATTINGEGWGVTVNDTTTAASDTLTFLSSNSGVGVTGSPTDTTTGTLVNTPTAATAYYTTGLVNTNVKDSSTTQGSNSGFTADTNGSGTATISYTDGAGQALNNTDLSSQADAQTALTDLNAAITDISAQDGYIGAQINTLNSVSSVLTTQQENVASAQNAVQATDYATATSAMSKYQILSQTGISALAQANSMAQEVTKLLQ